MLSDCSFFQNPILIMSDDLLGMLYNNLSPERKLLTAITNHMSVSISTLIDTGGPTLLNARLQTENGRTALHIASQLRQVDTVKKLVEAGADVTIKDLFGLTGLDLSLRKGSVDCARILLENDARPCTECLQLVWPGTQEVMFNDPPSDPMLGIVLNPQDLRQELVSWLGWMRDANETLMSLMVVAAPQINPSFVDIARQHLPRNAFLLFLNLFLMTGNKLPPTQRTLITSGADQSELDVFKRHQSLHSLQHWARTAIRRNLAKNAHYAAKQLFIPHSLKGYLVFSER